MKRLLLLALLTGCNRISALSYTVGDCYIRMYSDAPGAITSKAEFGAFLQFSNGTTEYRRYETLNTEYVQVDCAAYKWVKKP